MLLGYAAGEGCTSTIGIISKALEFIFFCWSLLQKSSSVSLFRRIEVGCHSNLSSA